MTFTVSASPPAEAPSERPIRSVAAGCSRTAPAGGSRVRALLVAAIAVVLILAGTPAPVEAASWSASVEAVVDDGQRDPQPSAPPARDSEASPDYTRVIVLAGGFGIVFIIVGVAFYRMLRRSRLE